MNDLYTVYDFVNTEIPTKNMVFGWASSFKGSRIELNYNMLNFDWKSLEYIGDDLFNMFLASKSFQNFKEKEIEIRKKYDRTFFTAYSIDVLKLFVKEAGFEIDIDKMIEAKRLKKTEQIIEKNIEKSKYVDIHI